ncbi:MAG: DUF1993 domain-containing protein [Rhodospirillaceae bacterium]
MALSMYDISVPAFRKMLGNLSAILSKAEAYAAARKIDPAVLLQSRLFPDMFPLTKQVQIACDFAKGAAARLSGAEVPKYDDNESTFEALRARIAKTLAFIETCKPEKFAGAESRTVNLMMGGTAYEFKGLDYLNHVAFPNFYFHVTTAYNILRHNGVELGKADFVGQI